MLLGVESIRLNVFNRRFETPLYLAAEVGFAEAVLLLLEHGADPSLCNRNEQTAAEVAPPQLREIIKAAALVCVSHITAINRLTFGWHRSDQICSSLMRADDFRSSHLKALHRR